MRLSKNGYYVEKYVKCANCGLLIYDQGIGVERDGKASCSARDWCIEWSRLRETAPGLFSAQDRPADHQDQALSLSDNAREEPGMPGTARYRFMVSMDVAAEKRDAVQRGLRPVNTCPKLMAVPGVLAVRGVKSAAVHGQHRRRAQGDAGGEPVLYRDLRAGKSAEVLVSDAWAQAVEAGRWPGEVRPFTSNRRHVLARVI